MLENTGNLWDYDVQVMGIATDGSLAANGSAVLGAGWVAAADQRFPEFGRSIGSLIEQHGNHCFSYAPRTNNGAGRQYTFLTIPVATVYADGPPPCAARSDLELIERSALEMVELADARDWGSIVLLRPGCATGGRAWVDVKGVLAPILDDRFTILAPVRPDDADRWATRAALRLH